MTPTQNQIGIALEAMGNYRVKRAQAVAHEGFNDGIGGALVLALGMRETWGHNVQGGAKLVNGKWVALDPAIAEDARKMDVGWLQINRYYHYNALKRMPAVKTGTWGPMISGHWPTETGFVPRFEESLRFTIAELREAIAFGLDEGVPVAEIVRFAVAAHNAGQGGALSGFNSGNVDRYTAKGDYSAWVLEAKSHVNDWLSHHPNWRP